MALARAPPRARARASLRFAPRRTRRARAFSSQPVPQPQPQPGAGEGRGEGQPEEQPEERRTLRVAFTCDACGARTEKPVNPRALARGTVYVQCGSCEAVRGGAWRRVGASARWGGIDLVGDTASRTLQGSDLGAVAVPTARTVTPAQPNSATTLKVLRAAPGVCWARRRARPSGLGSPEWRGVYHRAPREAPRGASLALRGTLPRHVPCGQPKAPPLLRRARADATRAPPPRRHAVTPPRCARTIQWHTLVDNLELVEEYDLKAEREAEEAERRRAEEGA